MANVLGLNNFSQYYNKDQVDSRDNILMTAIDAKAPKQDPTFIGTVTLPSVDINSNDRTAATTAFVTSKLNALIDNAPEALNTINELAAALNDDNNFAVTMSTALNNRYTKTEADALLATKVNNTDNRLTDTRTPSAGSVVNASVATNAAIDQSKISGLVDALASKLDKTGGTLSGGLTGTSATFTTATVGGQSVVVTNDSRLHQYQDTNNWICGERLRLCHGCHRPT